MSQSQSQGGTYNSEDDKPSMDPPAINEGRSSGGNSRSGGGGGGGGGGVLLKKGPWTTAEDMILVEYVKKHGEGNWNAVQKYSGLSRCGKSCRLRWANHLRPNLKKGAFTPEEERLIIELHAKMGNKWARMAAHLPGRTDNEIKNYWNTRIKRRQRAGLPLYPPELSVQSLQENRQNQIGDQIHCGDNGHGGLLQTNGYGIPDMFGNLRTSHGGLPYIPPLPDFSAGSSQMKGLGSPQLYGFVPPTGPCQKRLREPLQPLSEYGGGIGYDDHPQLDSDQDDNCRSGSSRSLDMYFPYNPETITKQFLSFSANQGRQSLLNGNFSASKPIIGAVKLELPSLQYPEHNFDSGFSHPSLPAFESVDSLIQSPSPGPLQSECPSPRSSGLLEALVYEAKALSGCKNPSSEKSSNSPTFVPGDVTECSPFDMSSTECQGFGNPNSPFNNSSASIFNECTPTSATTCLLEENPSAENFSECNVKPEPIDHTWNLEGEEKEAQLDFSRPDAMLGSSWFRQSASCAIGQEIVTDAIAALLGDDLSSDYQNMAGGSKAASTGFGFGSRSWKNLPPVCQMSEQP